MDIEKIVINSPKWVFVFLAIILSAVILHALIYAQCRTALFGMPFGPDKSCEAPPVIKQQQIASGVVAITDSKDYPVVFEKPFNQPPVVTFGSIYSEHSKGEAFATMTSEPSSKGFSVRLVRVGAGGSAPGDWARGKVHWVAVGK